jgi:hypothetical protein
MGRIELKMKLIEPGVNNKKGPIKVMMIVAYLLAIMMVSLPAPSLGAAVGYFADVRDKVNLSQQGQPPPKKALIGEGVKMMDVVSTDDSGRAQIKFIDGSLLTIAPRSQVVVDNYLFDPKNKTRQASLSFIKGFFHILLGYSIKSEQPDFIVDTVTAVLGVRGTGWYTIAEINFTDVFCETGKLSIKSKNLSEMVAISGYQATRVWQGKPPLPPLPITSKDLSLLKMLLDSGLPSRYDPGNNPLELLNNLNNSETSRPSPSWSPAPSPLPPIPVQTAPAFRGGEPKPPVTPPPTPKPPVTSPSTGWSGGHPK